MGYLRRLRAEKERSQIILPTGVVRRMVTILWMARNVWGYPRVPYQSLLFSGFRLVLITFQPTTYVRHFSIRTFSMKFAKKCNLKEHAKKIHKAHKNNFFSLLLLPKSRESELPYRMFYMKSAGKILFFQHMHCTCTIY